MNDTNNDFKPFPEHSGIQKRVLKEGSGDYPPNNNEVEGKL